MHENEIGKILLEAAFELRTLTCLRLTGCKLGPIINLECSTDHRMAIITASSTAWGAFQLGGKLVVADLQTAPLRRHDLETGLSIVRTPV